jgi:hypothetical protein
VNATPLDPMDIATWERDRLEIEAQVKAIRACGRSSKIGRETLVLSVHGDARDALVAEVIRTAWGAVVVTYESRGGVRAIEPLTANPHQTFRIDGYQPLTAARLIGRITSGAKRLKLLTPTTANQERVIVGHRPNADPETVAKLQVSRLRGALRTRREQGHDAAQIAGTEEYLAQAEDDLAAIRQRTRRERR